MTNFELQIPLTKSYTNDTDEYHLAFSISTTQQDTYGDWITEKAINKMLDQAKGLTINVDHQHDLNNLIGPVTDAWIEKKDETSYLWVDVHVRQAWVDTIKELVNSGVKLGGSIEGKIINKSYTDAGEGLIEDLRLVGASLTPIPANTATLGTAVDVEYGCPGSLCVQMQKALKEVDTLPNTKKEIDKEIIEEKKTDESVKNPNKAIETLSEKLDNVLSKLTNKTSSESSENDENDEKSKLEKEISELKAENTGLKKSIMEKEEEAIVNKALKLNKKLNPNTKIINKEALLDEIKSLSKNDTDVYLQLESYNKGLELALKAIPEGDMPQVSSNTLDKSESNLQERVLSKTRKLNEIGKEE